MKISYNWLKDYVDIKVAAEKLAAMLTMAGLTVDSIKKQGDDSILEIEVTSNRPDWLSYIGVGREVAAITGRKLKEPVVKLSKRQETRDKRQVSVRIEDKKLCPRYTARVIKNVKVAESPDWLKKKIESIGLRSVNNIVDITNFCLFETGEPLHAFDLDKLSGPAIIVRCAKKGEKIAAIDGIERQLDDSMLVIADSSKPVAIAGVMGGLQTEVVPATKNILLEAAYFDPISVRRTSRKLALSTESSYRFERKVDMANIVHSSDRATQLILKLAGGEPGELIDLGSSPAGKKTAVTLRIERLNKILGIDINPTRVKNILSSLGFKIKASSKKSISAEVPVFRSDVMHEIDLVEEVARIYGYDNMPAAIPSIAEQGARLSSPALVMANMRCLLASSGCREIITYSLLSKKVLTAAGISDTGLIEIKNPLSAEQEALQPTLITGMLSTMRWNLNRKAKDLKLFELGEVYFKQGANTFEEKRAVSIGVTGRVYDGWLAEPRAITFFDLKGIVETLLSGLGIRGISFKDNPYGAFSAGISASIEIKGETLGIIGRVAPTVTAAFDIKDDIYIAQLDTENIIKYASLEKHFKEPPRYPSIVRDVSIIVDKAVRNADIVSLIKETAGDILKEVNLIDKYQGGQIPGSKLALTYRLEYQDPNRTLEEKQVQDVHSRIIRALESTIGARLRQ